jgi:hypothetical protein
LSAPRLSDPAGSVGLVYWYLLYPVHHTIFKAMLRGLKRAIQPDPNRADGSRTTPQQNKLRKVVGAGRFERQRRLVL